MIKTYGDNQAITAATRAVNDAVEKVLSNLGIDYEKLSSVTLDKNGEVSSIETNTANVNIFKSTVSKEILEQLDNQEIQKVNIPLGSLAGGLLTGRGPNITIRVPMNSTVETVLNNKFEGAGINQTKHDISLDVKVKIFTVVQGVSTENVVETNFTIAERILVGEVPQWIMTPTA
jgi:sporulation protein YunB